MEVFNNMDKEKESKRKTFTSTEVKNRYNKKTYERYSITLRKDNITDKEIIDKIEKLKSEGLSASEAIKKLIIKG